MNGSNGLHAPGALLPLLGADDEAIAYFAGVADLDATDPSSHELEDGVRLASGDGWSSDAFCFVGGGGEERPVVYVSLDGEAGPLGLGLAAPWWRDAHGRTAEELRAVADEYRENVPDLDARRDRAARALGLDPAGVSSEVAVLTRLVDRSRGPMAATCLVLGYEGEPLDPLFDAASGHP
ncbi:hypothetical protein [Streptomyces goshikiensis]|uniref:hypothetical protein n=1 Tax=Streptomyces goshikiensis TaxID=1942 RepID=UPI003677130D